MFILLEFIILLSLLYIIGKLIYKRNNEKKLTFIKVILNFFLIIVTNAIIISLFLGSIFSIMLLFSSDAESLSIREKFPTVQFLLILLIVIISVAILQFILRKKFLKKFTFLQLDVEEYEICEYYIQWVTIYVVVYQFLFDGISSIFKILPELNLDHAYMFSVILSPNNINLVIQPLLISTWILVVMEKIKLRTKLEENK